VAGEAGARAYQLQRDQPPPSGPAALLGHGDAATARKTAEPEHQFSPIEKLDNWAHQNQRRLRSRYGEGRIIPVGAAAGQGGADIKSRVGKLTFLPRYRTLSEVQLDWPESQCVRCSSALASCWRVLSGDQKGDRGESPYPRICHAASLDQLPLRPYLHCIIDVGDGR
jgi:hypothetical protein